MRDHKSRTNTKVYLLIGGYRQFVLLDKGIKSECLAQEKSSKF